MIPGETTIDDWYWKEIYAISDGELRPVNPWMIGPASEALDLFAAIRRWFESTFIDVVPPVRDVILLAEEVSGHLEGYDRWGRFMIGAWKRTRDTPILRQLAMDSTLPEYLREDAVRSMPDYVEDDSVIDTIALDRSLSESLRISALYRLHNDHIRYRVIRDKSESRRIREAALTPCNANSIIESAIHSVVLDRTEDEDLRSWMALFLGFYHRLCVAYDDTESCAVRIRSLWGFPDGVLPHLLSRSNLPDALKNTIIFEYMNESYDGLR